MGHKTVTRLNRAHTMQLINEVKKRRFLWDRTEDDYSDRCLMAAAWKEIATIIELPERTLQMKWKQLRNNFIKLLRKAVITKRTKWRYFKPLMFIGKGKIISYKPVKSDMLGKKHANKDIINICDKEHNKNDHNHSDNDDASQNEYDINFNDENGVSSENVMKTDEEFDLMFLESLAPFFRQLEPMRKLVVRSKMQDMLLNEVIGHQNSKEDIDEGTLQLGDLSDASFTIIKEELDISECDIGSGL